VISFFSVVFCLVRVSGGKKSGSFDSYMFVRLAGAPGGKQSADPPGHGV